MRLTWRDAWATVLTAAVVALYWALQAGVDLGLLTTVRGVAGVGLLLGITTCGVGSARDLQHTPGYYMMGAVGVIALLAGVLAVITASDVALTVSVFAIAALWFATTLRHAMSPVAGEREKVAR